MDVMKRSKDNVVNFINTLLALEFPSSGIFSCADLESTGWEDRHGRGLLLFSLLHALLLVTTIHAAKRHMQVEGLALRFRAACYGNHSCSLQQGTQCAVKRGAGRALWSAC